MSAQTEPRTELRTDRRTLLRGVGAASCATIAIAVPSPPAHAYDPGEAETRARYRETEHVKAFYRTNGYETLER